MADFNVRSDSVNVEQIMDQIRTRIREKRGVDYTEQQIRELAAVKLEKFIDPGGVRSDLLQQFRKARPAYQPPELPNFKFEDATLYESHRGFIRVMRQLLNPILKLFFNPNPLIQALNIQARLNAMNAERDARVQASRTGTEQLLYEVIHNLVVELTRSGIEVKNLKMRVESLASRVEFNERRARALESVVVYKASSDEPVRPQQAQPSQQAAHQHSMSPGHPGQPPQQSGSGSQSQPGFQGAQGGQSGPPGEGPGLRSRRRRRRRGRRGGGSAAAIMGAPPAPGAPPVAGAPPIPQPSESASVSPEPEPEAPHDPAADEPDAPEEG